MKAYIKWARSQAVEVEVKQRTIDASGYVRIEDVYGIVYETHLSNVIFMEANDESNVR